MTDRPACRTVRDIRTVRSAAGSCSRSSRKRKSIRRAESTMRPRPRIVTILIAKSLTGAIDATPRRPSRATAIAITPTAATARPKRARPSTQVSRATRTIRAIASPIAASVVAVSANSRSPRSSPPTSTSGAGIARRRSATTSATASASSCAREGSSSTMTSELRPSSLMIPFAVYASTTSATPGTSRSSCIAAVAASRRRGSKKSVPEITAVTISPSGASSSRRWSASADALPSGESGRSAVRSNTPPPTMAPITAASTHSTITATRNLTITAPSRASGPPTVRLLSGTARGGPHHGPPRTDGQPQVAASYVSTISV